MSKFTAAIGRKSVLHESPVVAFARRGDGGFVISAAPRGEPPAKQQALAAIELDGPDLASLVQGVAGMIPTPPTPEEQRSADKERIAQLETECQRLAGVNGALEEEAADCRAYRRNVRDALTPILEASDAKDAHDEQ
jgi:hypothetical protein